MVEIFLIIAADTDSSTDTHAICTKLGNIQDDRIKDIKELW